jgi:hypothetical protein
MIADRTGPIQVRHEPLTPGTIAKRDGKTLDLTHDFSRRLFDVSTKGLDIGVSCSPCGIEGSVNVDLDIETQWKIPRKAQLSITPQNLAAAMELSMHVGGTLKSGYNPGELNIISVPITGFNVLEIFKIGAFLTVVSTNTCLAALKTDICIRMLVLRLANGLGQPRRPWVQGCRFRMPPFSGSIS